MRDDLSQESANRALRREEDRAFERTSRMIRRIEAQERERIPRPAHRPKGSTLIRDLDQIREAVRIVEDTQDGRATQARVAEQLRVGRTTLTDWLKAHGIRWPLSRR